jgi:hypothetical protein
VNCGRKKIAEPRDGISTCQAQNWKIRCGEETMWRAVQVIWPEVGNLVLQTIVAISVDSTEKDNANLLVVVSD